MTAARRLRSQTTDLPRCLHGAARLSGKSWKHDKQAQRNAVVLTRQSSSVKPAAVLLHAAGNDRIVRGQQLRGRTFSVSENIAVKKMMIIMMIIHFIC